MGAMFGYEQENQFLSIDKPNLSIRLVINGIEIIRLFCTSLEQQI